MYDEIIPDSEPEREEQRHRLDEEKRAKRTRKRLVPEPTRSMSFVLSSSPEPDLRLPSPLPKKSPPKRSDTKSVISISDDSSSEAEMLVPKFSSAVTHPSVTKLTHPEPGPSRLSPSRERSTPASHASGSEPTAVSRSLSSSDLSRYSYNPPQSLRDMIKKRGELEAKQIAQFGPPEPLRKSKVARPAAHRFTAHFTDDDLSRILKCVSCNERWTVRKGAAAKMRHIQSCAKKNGLTDDMIKGLIRAELEAPEEPMPRNKHESSGVANTLFEDALGDAGKSKNKRKQVQRTTTLHNPADNREAILAKAQSLLPKIRNLSQEQELLELLKKSDSTMDRIDMFDFSGPPPATQEFSRSKLGQRTSSTVLSVLPDSSPKMSTTSRLAGTGNSGRRLDLFTGEEMDPGPSPISINSSIDLSFERLSLEPLNFPDGNVQSDHDKEGSWHNDSAIIHYNQREEDLDWNVDDLIRDDAILHFDPDERELPLPPKRLTLLQTLVPTCTPSTTLNPAVPTLQDRAEQVKGRKATKPRSRKKKADVQLDESTQPTKLVDARLESKMLDAIREDEEFYHRILRYDPIPLEEFVALAIMLDFPTRGLQTRVMRFLDEQASRYPARGK
ncbi:hypothetical protein BJ322DRAFT_1158464 [Thelephora terrestris]|uniref:Structure-specific endonuclease subunit SLX4 n=1 Tax=Thelephora terrestris TaxID=56493 RepID=A0A9P6HAC6_9AGAM|nr:hypothetical protein BJ322DRAFT_1158464 [Thelephora terrestris]